MEGAENLASEYEQSIRITIQTEEEVKATGFAIGSSIMPLPENAADSFERLVKLYAQTWCEGLQNIFIRTYPRQLPSIIRSELKILDDFVEQAEKSGREKEAYLLSPANSHFHGSKWLDLRNDKQLEYLRLTTGYYEANMADHAWNSIASQVYGTYVLFRRWLQKKLVEAESLTKYQETIPLTGHEKRTIYRKRLTAATEIIPTNLRESVVESFVKIFKTRKSYNLLEEIKDLPWLEGIDLKAPDINVAYKYFEERVTNRSFISEDDRLDIAYSQSMKDLFDFYRIELGKIKTKAGRIAYIKDLLKRVYIKPGDYEKLNKLSHSIKEETFEEFGVPINEEIKNELSEIGCAAFLCALNGMSMSRILEQELQGEGVLVQDGWIMNKLFEPKDPDNLPFNHIIELDFNKSEALVVPDLNSEYVSLFKRNSDALACLRFMEDINLIGSDGKHRIGDRDKAQLYAFIEALQQKGLMPLAIPTANITSIIAQQISLSYPRPRKEAVKKYDDFLGKYFDILNSISTGKLTWSIMADNG
jgi:hypothetical protein